MAMNGKSNERPEYLSWNLRDLKVEYHFKTLTFLIKIDDLSPLTAKQFVKL
jgi:hypothetical protein